MKKTSKFIFLISIVFALIFINFSWTFINVKASPERYHRNFNDENPEIAWKINDNTYGDMENLAVTYYMGAGTCLIRGVRYKYNNVGVGPYQVEIRYVGDTMYVSNLDTNIPRVTSDSWRTLRNIGPIYLLDDNPEIHFIGMDPSDDCISLCADSPSQGHSYYDVGSGWTLDNQYEYIAEVIYEWVEILPIGEKKSGFINATDNIDAYFVSLEAGIDYKFVLELTSGSGNLNMRVVTYQDLTNDALAQSSGNLELEFLSYTPTSTKIYVLLVEAQTAGLDIANYSIEFYKELSPIWIDDNGGGDYTWAEAALEHWCSGSGTKEVPYVIENVIINAKLASYCLKIEDSEPSFVVKNCWFFNASYGIYLSHIYNYNNNNSQCVNNIITNCSVGMYAFTLYNLNISENHIFNNNRGIWIGSMVGNFSCTGNIIFNNSGDGIYAYMRGDNHIIRDNTIYNNSGDGIYAYGAFAEHIFVIDNIIYNNSGDGIELVHDDGDSGIVNNIIYNNKQNGIRLSDSSYRNISNNRVTSNNAIGIEISNSAGNILFDENEVSYNSKDGINVISSNCNFTANKIFHNGDNGMVISGDNNKFWNNSVIENSKDGLKLSGSNNGIFLNNFNFNLMNGLNFTGNDNDICENNFTSNLMNGLNIKGNNNEIGENNVTYNLLNGINLIGVENSIFRNNISYNFQNGLNVTGTYNFIQQNEILGNHLNGIFVYGGSVGCLSTDIYYNKISFNERNGILLVNIINIICSVNIVSHNGKCGVYIIDTISSEYTWFFSNNITENLEYGIIIKDSSYCEILFNRFIDNTINALDNGTNNVWDHNGQGNYWDDYSGCGPYLILGSAGAKDNYPEGYKVCPQSPPLNSEIDDDDSENGKEENDQNSISGSNCYFTLMSIIIAVFISIVIIRKKLVRN